MTALLFDAGGDTLRDRPVAWSSSDTARVQVSPSGLASTRAHGTATITATVDGVSGGALVRVLEPVAFVSVSPVAATLVPGGSLDLDAILIGVSGTLLSDRDVSWSSTGDAVGVAANGVVTGLRVGTGSVRTSSEGITSTEITVGVRPATFTRLVAGQSARHTCGFGELDQPFCWGDNLEGALGNGTFTFSGFGASGLPFATGTLGGAFSDLGLGAGFTCGVAGGTPPTPGGLVYCWGAADHNKLGNGSFTNRATATPVNGRRLAVSVVVGAEHGCLLQADSLAYCWGTTTVEPTAVPGAKRFHTLVAGYHESCGLAADTLAYCWGVGTGIGNPVATPGGLRFVQLTMGFQHKCGIATDGATYCWGLNSAGQLGDGTTTFRTNPVPVGGATVFTSVVAGREFTCGLTAAGAAYCWGANDGGQLGSVAGPQSTTPVPVAGNLTFRQLVAGDSHACGLTTAFVSYCWGWNAVGQLGDGTKIDRPTPVRVAGQP